MGLWGSKEQRNITIKNTEPAGQVFVTEDAITNVLETVNESNKPKTKAEPTRIEEPAAKNAELDLRLLPDLHDKRINEYEKNLISSLEQASKEVENLFRERYTTMPVCLNLQQQVSQCYSENPNKTLNCLDIANKFVKCVEQERQRKLGK